jgi:hypothetical protein
MYLILHQETYLLRADIPLQSFVRYNQLDQTTLRSEFMANLKEAEHNMSQKFWFLKQRVSSNCAVSVNTGHNHQ